MTQITVLNPKVIEEVDPVTPAGRLKDLKGVRVGFVDNSKMNADLFIKRLGERLSDQYGIEVGTVVRKLAPKDLLAGEDVNALSQCGAIVQCFGDCGTSTSMLVADAVTPVSTWRVSRSIPATSVVTYIKWRSTASQKIHSRRSLRLMNQQPAGPNTEEVSECQES